MKKIILILLLSPAMFFFLSSNAFSYDKNAISGYEVNCTRNEINIFATFLNKYGVKTNFFGDNIFLSLPLYKVFKKGSKQIKSAALPALSAIGNFLACYPTPLVRVTVRNNTYRKEMVGQNVSQKQALAIMHYLKRKKMNTSLMVSIADQNLIKKVSDTYIYPEVIIDIKRVP